MEQLPLPATAILPQPRVPAAPARQSEGRARRKTANRGGLLGSRVLPGPGLLPPAPATMGKRGRKGLRNLAEELNGVERRGEGLGRGGLGGGGRSAAAGGRRARRSKSASQTLQQSPELGRRRRPWRRRRRRRRRRRPRRRDDPAPRPRASQWPRVCCCAQQRCWSEERARRGAGGGPGGGAPRRSELAGARGLEPRRPRVSGGRGRGAQRSGRWRRRKRPGSAARGGGGGVGRQGRGGVGASGRGCLLRERTRTARWARRPGDVWGWFPGKSCLSCGVRISPGTRGARAAGPQVGELAPGSLAGPCGSWAVGRPPGGPGAGPDTGGPGQGRALLGCSLGPEPFSPCSSGSRRPGRSGRRRAQLPASRSGASLLGARWIPDRGK